MTIEHNLLGDSLPVLLDDRSALVGGCFWKTPLQTYGPAALIWAYEQLSKQTNPVLLDIGASTGCFSLLAKYVPGMTVDAFEPVPETCDILYNNLELNNIMFAAHEVAVSDFNGTVDNFHVVYPKGGSGVSMLGGVPQAGKLWNDIEVQVITIDMFCSTYYIEPTMIKIDTEGNELAVLRGGAKTIEKYHPVIIAEYEPLNTAQYNYTPDAIVEWLESRGYECINPHGEDLFCVWKGE